MCSCHLIIILNCIICPVCVWSLRVFQSQWSVDVYWSLRVFQSQWSVDVCWSLRVFQSQRSVNVYWSLRVLMSQWSADVYWSLRVLQSQWSVDVYSEGSNFLLLLKIVRIIVLHQFISNDDLNKHTLCYNNTPSTNDKKKTTTITIIWLEQIPEDITK